MISTCLHCKVEFKFFPSQSRGKYCTTTCSAANRKAATQKKISKGYAASKAGMRAWLIEKFGNQCHLCKMPPLWQGKPLRLHLDHKDGNSDNGSHKNMRLLCPNCHSQTPTYSNKLGVKKFTRRNIKTRHRRAGSLEA